jgi:hypothetical protein
MIPVPNMGQNSLFLVLSWWVFDAGFRCENLNAKATKNKLF